MDTEKKSKKKANIIKIFEKEKSLKTEFNSNLKIKLDSQNIENQNLLSLSNNLGILNFQNNINRSSKFKFSKIKNFNYFEPNCFDGKNFIFLMINQIWSNLMMISKLFGKKFL